MIIIESESIEEIKKEIENLSEYNILFEELEQSALFNPETSMHIANNDFLQSRILISEILEKREISGRISNLSLNIESLRQASLENNDEKIKEKISLILNNEYSSIKTIISELSSLKNNINEFGAHERDALARWRASLEELGDRIFPAPLLPQNHKFMSTT